MPRPSLRTRSRKHKRVNSPGAQSKIHFRKEKTAAPYCSVCGQPLAGIPHLPTSEVRRLNRSKRRIWRPYGGQLCHNCLKNILKQAVRTA